MKQHRRAAASTRSANRASGARGATADSELSTLDWRTWLYALAPIVVAVVVYAPAGRNGFVWDDPLVLDQLRQMRDWWDVLFPPDAVPKFYYRPFIFLTFFFDRWLGGGDPFAFHAAVIVWHGLVTGLVFLLARRLLGAAHALEAGVAALLFAVHPIHVESVAWIAGRSDVIATAFVLLALWLSTRTRQRWTAWAAGALVLLGCWSKEIALTGVALIPLRDLLIDGRLVWRRYPPLLIAVGIYLASRYAALSALGGGLPAEASAAHLTRDLLAAFGWYALKLAVPVPQHAFVPRVPAGELYPVVGVAALAAVVLGSIWGRRARRGVVSFLLLGLAVTVVPSLGVIVRRSASAVLAERYLYLPSVAAVIVLAWVLAQLRRTSTGIRGTALAVVLILSVAAAWQSMRRTGVWADNLAFWSDVVEKAPEDGLAQRELADAYMARDRLEEAERHYEAALAAETGREERVMSYNNLANLYLRRNQFDEADAVLTAALKLYPHPHLYSGLGRLAMKRAEAAQARGDQAEVKRQVLAARAALDQAVSRDPSDYKSHVLLGQVLLSLGQREAARGHLEESLRIQPAGTIADVARQYLRLVDSR